MATHDNATHINAIELDAVWSDYADRIKAAGEAIIGEGFPADPRMRAEGYRFVSRLTNLAHKTYVDFGSSTHPVLWRHNDDITPFGAPNVDNNYYRAMVDPAGTYRITANVAGVQELLFSVQDGEFVFGKTAVLAEAGLEDLALGPDGELELFLGGPERPSNWLPLGDDAVYINVREFVTDWEHGPLPELVIERLDQVDPPAALTPEALAEAYDLTARWVEASVPMWNQYAGMLKQFTATNQLAAPSQPAGSAANMLHGGTIWDLEPHQALLFEFDQPEVSYWGIQTYIADWLIPLDYANRVTSLNDRQLVVDEDGRTRIVLSATDPGVPNWLDVEGHPTGLVTYRYVKATNAPAPTTALIDVADVRAHVPASTPVFGPDARAAQVATRRRGVARRFRR